MYDYLVFTPDLGAPYARDMDEFKSALSVNAFRELPRIKDEDTNSRDGRIVYEDYDFPIFYVNQFYFEGHEIAERILKSFQNEYRCYKDAKYGGFSVPAHTCYTGKENGRFDSVIVLAKAKGIKVEKQLEDAVEPSIDPKELKQAAGYEGAKAMAYFNDFDRLNDNMFVTVSPQGKFIFTQTDFENANNPDYGPLRKWYALALAKMIGRGVALDRHTLFDHLQEMHISITKKAMPSPVYAARVEEAMTIVRTTPYLDQPSF